MSKDRRLASYLDRLTTTHRRAQLLKNLQKEVAEELSLQSFEEWSAECGQQKLFN